MIANPNIATSPCGSSGTSMAMGASAARAAVTGIIDLADLKVCVMAMSKNHGQWRSHIARLVFSAAKERVAAQRDQLRSAGYESAWLNRVDDAKFKHPQRDAFSTDVDSLLNDLAVHASRQSD